MEKSSEKLKSQKDFYHNFLQEMDAWLVRNADKIIKMFKEFDEDGESIITYDEFKSGNYAVLPNVFYISLQVISLMLAVYMW